MPFFFEINDSLGYTLEVLTDTGALDRDLTTLFKNAISNATLIGKKYENMAAGDRKILGQERTQLIESLDALFTSLVILHQRLSRSLPVKPDEQESRKKVPLRVRYNKITASGALSTEDVKRVRRFSTEYNARVLDKLKEMLLRYKNALGSTDRQAERFSDLFRILDSILYETLIIRYSIQNLLVDQ
jgi:hypothetical protein